MKVLVVDDVSANRHILVALLKRMGHATVDAADPEEAERLFLSDSPDVVLTDLHLGEGRDGVELAARLRRLPGGTAVRIGLMTADVTDSLKASGIFDAVIEKPVGLEELQSFLKGS